MGIAVPSELLGRQHNNHIIQITMKAFAAAALATVAAASAAPEAEPWLVAPAVVPVPINPHATTGELVTLPNGAQVPDTTVSVKAAAADHLNAKAAAYGYGLPLAGLWKREADAEAEPWLGYAAPYAYAAAPAVGSPVAGLVAHPDGSVTPPYTPAQQAVTADHFARRGGVWWGKRSAEAEPWLGYGYGLAGWGLAGWGPAGIAAPKSAPCVNAWNVPVPC